MGCVEEALEKEKEIWEEEGGRRSRRRRRRKQRGRMKDDWR